jgi:hypothetical protein
LPEAQAQDQTFRLILKPDLWSGTLRLRFSHVFGAHPLPLDGIYVGVHATAGRLLPGTNRPVRFTYRNTVTIAPGHVLWSDPLTLDFVDRSLETYAERKLAVSFHVAGESGLMTWHAKAMQTSYLSPP